MKFLKPTLVLASLAILMSSCNSKKIGKTEIKTEVDTFSYALGINMGNNLKNSKIEGVNITAFANGLQDILDGKKDAMTNEKAIEHIQKYFGKLQEKLAEKNLEEGKKFLEENGKKEGVVTDTAGFQYKMLQEGSGPMPKETDVVKVHYKGTLIDGTEFDSSYKRNEPAQFPLNGVIRGWTLGLQKMKVGSKFMLYIPGNLAYGPSPRGGQIGPNQFLIFEVELLEIVNTNTK